MPIVPPQHKETTLGHVDRGMIEQKDRPYLGMSSIGHECSRALFYGFRWVSKREITQRTKRIFNRGDIEEPRIISRLREIGIQVYGEQVEITSCFGHAKGHIDAMCLGVIEAPQTPHLAEFKTMKASKWKECVKKGVQDAAPVYYGQFVRYMAKMHLTRTLFIAVNKDTEEWYIERLEADPEFNRELVDKEKSIIMTDEPPRKIGDASWYACKWCDHYKVCHSREPVKQNCRTCLYGEIHPNAEWHCGHPDRYPKDKVLSVPFQRIGCDSWEILPSLI